MTPDDFLRSMTPGVKQPPGNYIKLIRMCSYPCFPSANYFCRLATWLHISGSNFLIRNSRE